MCRVCLVVDVSAHRLRDTSGSVWQLVEQTEVIDQRRGCIQFDQRSVEAELSVQNDV